MSKLKGNTGTWILPSFNFLFIEHKRSSCYFYMNGFKWLFSPERSRKIETTKLHSAEDKVQVVVYLLPCVTRHWRTEWCQRLTIYVLGRCPKWGSSQKCFPYCPSVIKSIFTIPKPESSKTITNFEASHENTISEFKSNILSVIICALFQT